MGSWAARNGDSLHDQKLDAAGALYSSEQFPLALFLKFPLKNSGRVKPFHKVPQTVLGKYGETEKGSRLKEYPNSLEILNCDP